MKTIVLTILLAFLGTCAFAMISRPLNDTIGNVAQKKIIGSITSIEKAIYDIEQARSSRLEVSMISKEFALIQSSLESINLVPVPTNIKEKVKSYCTTSQQFIDRNKKIMSKSKQNVIPYAVSETFLQDLTLLSTQTSTFEAYIQSLTPPDQTVIKLLNTIDSDIKAIHQGGSHPPSKLIIISATELNALNDSITEIDKKIIEIKGAIGTIDTKTDVISTDVKKVDGTTTAIKTTLQPIPSSKNILSLNFYNNNLFGISYFSTISKSTDPVYKTEGDISQHLGVQFIFPVSSTTAKDPGGFVMYALRDRKLVLQAGGGYLNNGKTQNISWICGALYFPKKLGIGLSYSPLTGTGLQIAARF